MHSIAASLVSRLARPTADDSEADIDHVLVVDLKIAFLCVKDEHLCSGSSRSRSKQGRQVSAMSGRSRMVARWLAINAMASHQRRSFNQTFGGDPCERRVAARARYLTRSLVWARCAR